MGRQQHIKGQATRLLVSCLSTGVNRGQKGCFRGFSGVSVVEVRQALHNRVALRSNNAIPFSNNEVQWIEGSSSVAYTTVCATGLS